MIGVTAKLPVRDGKQADFENLFKDLMAKVKANEPDCTMYQLFKAKGSDTDYIMMETYATKEALDAHGKTEHFLAAQAGLGACLAGAPVIEVFDLVE